MRIIKRIILFYVEGFRGMTVGKTLWVIILLKLFILFGILKVFFFRNFLDSRFEREEEKSEYVLEKLVQ